MSSRAPPLRWGETAELTGAGFVPEGVAVLCNLDRRPGGAGWPWICASAQAALRMLDKSLPTGAASSQPPALLRNVVLWALPLPWASEPASGPSRVTLGTRPSFCASAPSPAKWSPTPWAPWRSTQFGQVDPARSEFSERVSWCGYYYCSYSSCNQLPLTLT